jgi:hypothetical protein
VDPHHAIMPPRALAAVALGCLGLSLGGCSSLMMEGATAGAGIAAAAAAGSTTDNPAVTAGVGLGAHAAARAAVKALQKGVHHAEQERIATAAGPLAVGAVARWSATHRLPVERNRHGEVTVSRLIRAGGLDCKELVFSVEEKADRSFFTTTICRDGQLWRWAAAEPATERWGGLQ